MALPGWAEAMVGPVSDFFVRPTLERYVAAFFVNAEREHPEEMQRVYWVHQNDAVLWGQFRTALVGGFTVAGIVTGNLTQRAGAIGGVLGEMLEQPINSMPGIVDREIQNRARAARFPDGYRVTEADALGAVGTMLKNDFVEHFREMYGRLIDHFGPMKFSLERSPDQHIRVLRQCPAEYRFGERGIITWLNRQHPDLQESYYRVFPVLNELGEVVTFWKMSDDERAAWIEYIWQGRKLRLPLTPEQLREMRDLAKKGWTNVLAPFLRRVGDQLHGHAADVRRQREESAARRQNRDRDRKWWQS